MPTSIPMTGGHVLTVENGGSGPTGAVALHVTKVNEVAVDFRATGNDMADALDNALAYARTHCPRAFEPKPEAKPTK